MFSQYTLGLVYNNLAVIERPLGRNCVQNDEKTQLRITLILNLKGKYLYEAFFIVYLQLRNHSWQISSSPSGRLVLNCLRKASPGMWLIRITKCWNENKHSSYAVQQSMVLIILQNLSYHMAYTFYNSRTESNVFTNDISEYVYIYIWHRI